MAFKSNWFDRLQQQKLQDAAILQNSYVSIVNMGFLTAESSLVPSGSQFWELSVDSDAQTNFLYAPAFAGQVMQFLASRVGGYRTINTSLALNGSGDVNMIFGASGGFASLVGIMVYSSLAWQIDVTNQVSLTPAA